MTDIRFSLENIFKSQPILTEKISRSKNVKLHHTDCYEINMLYMDNKLAERKALKD